MELSSLLSGGLGAALVGGLFIVAQVLLNKKLRTPTDVQAAERAAITERNEILASYRADLSETKAELKGLQVAMKAAQDEIGTLRDEMDEMREEHNAFVHWGYRAVAVIRRLGTDEDVPKPVPAALKI